MFAETTKATNVTAGLGGFLVLFFLGLACWFLFRNMNQHLRRVRYEAGDLTSRHKETRHPADPQTRAQQPGDDTPAS